MSKGEGSNREAKTLQMKSCRLHRTTKKVENKQEVGGEDGTEKYDSGGKILLVVHSRCP